MNLTLFPRRERKALQTHVRARRIARHIVDPRHRRPETFASARRARAAYSAK
jgi:hypothetical protein